MSCYLCKFTSTHTNGGCFASKWLRVNCCFGGGSSRQLLLRCWSRSRHPASQAIKETVTTTATYSIYRPLKIYLRARTSSRWYFRDGSTSENLALFFILLYHDQLFLFFTGIRASCLKAFFASGCSTCEQRASLENAVSFPGCFYLTRLSLSEGPCERELGLPFERRGAEQRINVIARYRESVTVTRTSVVTFLWWFPSTLVSAPAITISCSLFAHKTVQLLPCPLSLASSPVFVLGTPPTTATSGCVDDFSPV